MSALSSDARTHSTPATNGCKLCPVAGIKSSLAPLASPRRSLLSMMWSKLPTKEN